MTTRNDKELLIAYFRGRDVVCPLCRYSLRDGEADRCPECGAGLELGVFEKRGGATVWWAGAVAGLGISTIMSLVLLVPLLTPVSGLLHEPSIQKLINAGFAPVSDAPNWWAIDCMALLTIVSAALFTLLLAGRRNFRRLRGLYQGILGLAGLLSPGLLLLILTALTRWVL